MSIISDVMSQVLANQGLEPTKEVKETSDKKANHQYGKTIGDPKLTDEGKKYYDQLKAKYNNLDFILVSKDMKETAKAQAGSYANPNKMVVLIDEEKIERMATDEDYRKKYEGLIAMAESQLPALKQSMDGMSGVKGYGMQVKDDGTASYFAVVDKANQAQAERIAKKREEKKASEKAEAKKEAKAKEEERLKEAREERKKATEKTEDSGLVRDLYGSYDADEVEVIWASSIEELLQKVQDYQFLSLSDQSFTQEELARGGHLDLKI